MTLPPKGPTRATPWALALCALALIWTCLDLRAADPEPSTGLEDLIRSGEDWARENLDDRVIEAFEQVDFDQFEPFWRSLQERFQGDYVVDLAALRDSATNLVVELEKNDETRPYGTWLRSRLDYFDGEGKFKDWRLALAAYNAGEGRVWRLLDRYKAKTFDDIATQLPAETQLYVPKIEAVILHREAKALAVLPCAATSLQPVDG